MEREFAPRAIGARYDRLYEYNASDRADMKAGLI